MTPSVPASSVLPSGGPASSVSPIHYVETPTLEDPSLFINRELSWLEFNQRVLDEASDPSVPLMERVKFLCISTSNLDEFFMVRVAGLKQQLSSGMVETGPDGLMPAEALARVALRAQRMVAEQYRLWHKELQPRLAQAGISFLSAAELDPEHGVAAREVRREDRDEHDRERAAREDLGCGADAAVATAVAVAKRNAARAPPARTSTNATRRARRLRRRCRRRRAAARGGNRRPDRARSLRAGDSGGRLPGSEDQGECAPGGPMRATRFIPSLLVAALIAGCAAADSFGDGELQVGHPASGAFSTVNEAGWASATWAQGAKFVAGEGSNLRVAVYAAHATRVLLEIYSAPTGVSAQYDYVMAKGSDGIWRAELASVPGKTLYAFRVWGPNWTYSASWTPGSAAGFVADVDASGNRYNPNKVVADPYARERSHDKTSPALIAAGLDGGAYGTGGATYHGVPRRQFDTGPWAPKSVAIANTTPTGTKPAIAAKDAVVYEAHVRGLTAHPSTASLTTILSGIAGFTGQTNIPAGCRGTYQAAGLMAPYLKGLGINVIELLPVHEADNDTNPTTAAGGNYWGYVTDGFFAADRHYACNRALGGVTTEWKTMVKAFHDAGIEVWLDVVYNHTGEGGNWDATKLVDEVSGLRGFDNIDFYELSSADKASYFDTTGVANNLNVSTPVGRRLVTDSLRYWATEMGVDGFRFDLAVELGRDAAPSYNYNPSAQLYLDIAALAATNNVDIVAEPWDLGAYGVGQFPSGWGEWNGKFRDASRRFLKGDLSGAGGLTYADAFYGDFGDYNDQGGPAKSVNFLVAHDGFTLTDLMSYGAKTNAARAWPFGPSDGGSDGNDSWDSGGDQALRRVRVRSALAWQVFSRGVPMLVAGDEFGRTQNGNNNPYNVDAPGTWNNYNMIATDSPNAVATGVTGEAYHNNLGTDAHADGKNALFQFTRQLLAIRKGATALRQASYTMPINFSKADGSAGYDSHTDRAVRLHLDGSTVGDADYVLYVNMWSGIVTFNPPAVDAGKRWVRLIDTAAWAESNDNIWTDATAATITGSYDAHPWSIVVLKAI